MTDMISVNFPPSPPPPPEEPKSIEFLQPGEYVVKIVGYEVKTSKGCLGQYIQWELECVDCDFTLWHCTSLREEATFRLAEFIEAVTYIKPVGTLQVYLPFFENQILRVFVELDYYNGKTRNRVTACLPVVPV